MSEHADFALEKTGIIEFAINGKEVTYTVESGENINRGDLVVLTSGNRIKKAPEGSLISGVAIASATSGKSVRVVVPII
jgi:phosphotransferase system IIA component